MAKSIPLFTVLFLSWAAAQPDASTTRPNRRDPFSGLLHDLGDIFLDVDEAIGRFVSPVEARQLENSKEPMYEKSRNERAQYFSRIKENYKTVQDRLGESLRLPNLLSSNSGPEIKASRSFVDVKVPLVPLRVSVSSTNQEKVQDTTLNKDEKVTDAAVNQVKLPRLELPSFSSNLKLNDMELKVRSNPEEFLLPEISLAMGQNTPFRFGRDPSSKSMQSQDKASTDATLFPGVEETTPVSTTEPSFNSRKGEMEGQTGVQGRILGDVLYSESTFDKLVRRAIKDHGKWALDPTLFPNRRVDKVTSKHEKKPSSNELRNSDTQRLQKDTDQESFPDGVPDSLRFTNQNRDGAMHNDKKKQSNHLSRSPEKLETENKILLAFTPDGVPLKLNMNLNLENPIEYLHDVLDSAGVSLNVPIGSSHEIKPVGTEVLQIGYGSGGRTQALNIDMSDKNQVKSLLKALRKIQKT